ncbi:MAG: ATP-binding cassette domain-containing protein [Desulfobulbaceae bacterium]|jgi:molybdate transport system ATP-binding protein|nr:ATP-binding cassette domain-containing protein [Desulfobulbaceae bacterium]
MEISIKSGLVAILVKKLPFFTLDLTIACEPGKTVVLTGPSGSGKTTVLRCLAGLEQIDEGHVNFDGIYWNDVSSGLRTRPQSRRVGFLSQDYILFPHMTLHRNIRFAMQGSGNPDEHLDAMGIGHLRNKRPHEISGGERQRAALCQTLASKPKLLLLDEPFSALDIENRHLLRRKLREVQEQSGLVIIHVTHDLAEALSVPAQIIPLRQGREDQGWLQRQKAFFIKDARQFYDIPTREAEAI